MDNAEFEQYTDTIQKIHFQFLEGKKYDVLLSNQLRNFPKILSNYMESVRAAELAEKIVCSSNLYYRIIIVNCYADGTVFTVPVVCVRLNENEEEFYDIECRRYKKWEQFLSKNRLPECLMKFPENGIYELVDGKLKFGRRNSPASGTLKKVNDVACQVARIGALLASVAVDIPMLQPYNKAILTVSGICNAYTVGHRAVKICDLDKHGQGWASDKSFCHWIDIGAGVLLFGVTLGKIKFGIHQSEEIAYANIFSIAKGITECKGDISSFKKIEVSLLSQHLTLFSGAAMDYFQSNVICSQIDAKELIFNIRRYVLKDNSLISKFRRFVNVEYSTVSTVAQDITLAREIPRLLRMEFYHTTSHLNDKVDTIMREVKLWANGNASTMQAMFRVAGICKSLKTYETLEEMCKHFNVSNPKEIRVNERYIFEGARGAFLELQNLYDVEKFPQFLSHAVEYLGEGGDDLEAFKKQLNVRVVKEMGMTPRVSHVDREWINALTLENLNYAHSVPAEGINGNPIEGINLVKPKFQDKATQASKAVTHVDLFKLAKRLLGRVGDLDLQLVRSDVKWVVVASKRSRYAVIVAPLMNLQDSGSVGGCYPVFKRLL